ncbi:hypothetical protein BBP40_004008 [Aspergillus hancockii]|nr:hypothetical protein BBP40_004008 [Aspergillus hancockii]
MRQVLAVLPNLSPQQQACAQLWIDEAKILQDHTFTLITLVDRMWGLTRREAAYAKLRIYGPFTLGWIQWLIPKLNPLQRSLVDWIVEHNRLVMEDPRALVDPARHRMPCRLVTPDLLFAGLVGLSPSKRNRMIKRVQPLCGLWNPRGAYPYITEDHLWQLAPQTDQQWWCWRLTLLPYRPRPVTVDQVSGVFPLLPSETLEKVKHFIRSRSILQGGWRRPSMERVVAFLAREEGVTDMELGYAKKLLGNAAICGTDGS